MVTTHGLCLPTWNASRAVYRFKRCLVLCILELTEVHILTINTQDFTTIILVYFEIYIGIRDPYSLHLTFKYCFLTDELLGVRTDEFNIIFTQVCITFVSYIRGDILRVSVTKKQSNLPLIYCDCTLPQHNVRCLHIRLYICLRILISNLITQLGV